MNCLSKELSLFCPDAVGDTLGDAVGDGLSVACTGTLVAGGASDVFWSGVVGVQPVATDKAIATRPVESILKLDIINVFLR
ncbi:hypothetical protein [Nostoc sp.]|uniref:hypothetical protein n=1 Tax=Nostoc sp. TaxID=1180 RepID=UPI002FF654A2